MNVAGRLILTRGLRQFAYGMLAVALAVALVAEGLPPVAIGALVTVALAGDLTGTALVGRYADGWGRRRTMVALAGLMALTGVVFSLTSWYPALVVAAFCGTLGTGASETAPFLPLEQAMLARVVVAARHTAIFTRYNIVALLAGSLGALAAALPDLLPRFGVARALALRLPFLGYAALAVVVAVVAWRLPPSVERDAAGDGGAVERPTAARLGASRGIVTRLAALFSVDALAGGLVAQTVLALFFHLRYAVPLVSLAGVFFAANALAGLSLLAAPWLAARFGLLNTMVFSHLPSNALLALVAFMPTFPLAAGMFLLRQSLSQLDVPTRQAYTMALVEPAERTAAASATSLARGAGAALSPSIAGLLIQGTALTLGLPLLLAGGIKLGYDLALWRVFRRVPLPRRT